MSKGIMQPCTRELPRQHSDMCSCAAMICNNHVRLRTAAPSVKRAGSGRNQEPGFSLHSFLHPTSETMGLSHLVNKSTKVVCTDTKIQEMSFWSPYFSLHTSSQKESFFIFRKKHQSLGKSTSCPPSSSCGLLCPHGGVQEQTTWLGLLTGWRDHDASTSIALSCSSCCRAQPDAERNLWSPRQVWITRGTGKLMGGNQSV